MLDYYLKYNTASAPFLLYFLAFIDERNSSMLTQSILTTSFIFIQKQKTYGISFSQTIPFLLTNLNCKCAIDIFVPKVFISLRLFLFRFENRIQNPTFPFLFIFFHSETKDMSCFIQKRKKYPKPQQYLSCLSSK